MRWRVRSRIRPSLPRKRSAVWRRLPHSQCPITRERASLIQQLAQCEKELKKWEEAYIANALMVDDLKVKKAERGNAP